MSKFKEFLKRKDIVFSGKRYAIDAMSAMAQGLFASLLIGTIFDTLGVQTANLFGENMISAFFVEIGGFDKGAMGAAIATLISYVAIWLLRAIDSRKILPFKINVKRNNFT